MEEDLFRLYAVLFFPPLLPSGVYYLYFSFCLRSTINAYTLRVHTAISSWRTPVYTLSRCGCCEPPRPVNGDSYFEFGSLGRPRGHLPPSTRANARTIPDAVIPTLRYRLAFLNSVFVQAKANLISSRNNERQSKATLHLSEYASYTCYQTAFLTCHAQILFRNLRHISLRRNYFITSAQTNKCSDMSIAKDHYSSFSCSQ